MFYTDKMLGDSLGFQHVPYTNCILEIRKIYKSTVIIIRIGVH